MAQKRNRSEWLDILSDLKNSTMTDKQCAANLGCHPTTISYQRKRLAGNTRSKKTFVELTTTEKTMPARGLAHANAAPAVFLEVRGGTKICFATLPDISYLRALIQEA